MDATAAYTKFSLKGVTSPFDPLNPPLFPTNGIQFRRTSCTLSTKITGQNLSLQPSKDMSKVSMLNIGCFFKSLSQTVQEGILGTRGISRPRGAPGLLLEFDRVMGDFTSPHSA